MVLASQKLEELYKTITCASNEFPKPVVIDAKVQRYEEGTLNQCGAVVCIEGVAYGDGQIEEDYSELVISTEYYNYLFLFMFFLVNF